MVTAEERMRILKMVGDGQISAEEGVRLLNALRGSGSASQGPRPGQARWFRVRVTDMATGRTKVNVNLPLSLVKAGIKMGAHFAPDMEDLDWDEMICEAVDEFCFVSNDDKCL